MIIWRLIHADVEVIEERDVHGATRVLGMVPLGLRKYEKTFGSIRKAFNATVGMDEESWRGCMLIFVNVLISYQSSPCRDYLGCLFLPYFQGTCVSLTNILRCSVHVPDHIRRCLPPARKQIALLFDLTFELGE